MLVIYHGVRMINLRKFGGKTIYMRDGEVMCNAFYKF